jgi:probable F420-dependent oxidoreductase
MKIGCFSFNTEYGIHPAELARAMEERGFESLWVGEHTHIPAERRSPYPGKGDVLPKPYYHMADPFVSLAMAAAVTKTLKVGTGICLVTERDPIVLAKEVATLDHLSGGRFLFGIGAGWNAEEMENHGTPFAQRWKVLEDRVKAMKTIWASHEATYEGPYTRFDRIISYPKPKQQPHPPIILGAATPYGRKRVVEFCDGWFPIDVLLKDLPDGMADLREKAKAAGRDPASIPVSIFAFEAGPDELVQYRDLGVDRVAVLVPRRKEDVMPFLDKLAPVVERLR